MPKVRVRNITLHYEEQGSGEPLILVPYLAADHACYAFQVAEYAKHFTCISVDLRGTGESDNPDGGCSIEFFADDVAALMQAIGIPRAHVFGLSLGAAIAMWLAAKYPDKVQSMSLHSAWTRTDSYIKTVVQGWQVMAKALGSVPEMIIQGIFPWCLTPELYAEKAEYVKGLEDFVRSRPALSVDTFIRHSNAVIAHDVRAQLSKIQAPVQLTFGSRDALTSTRFAGEIAANIRECDLVVFEGCSHAPIYERSDEFNQRTLAFLHQQSGTTRAAHG